MPDRHFRNLYLSIFNTINGFILDYGVLHSWRCKHIFPLNSNDLDDINYLHTNGKLYMIDKEPLDLEKYCVENVLTPNGSTAVSYQRSIFNCNHQKCIWKFICRFARFFVMMKWNMNNQLNLNIIHTVKIHDNSIFNLEFWSMPDIISVFFLGISISCIFLAATLIVYLSLPKVF